MDRLDTDVGGMDLADYAARLRRRWWVVALSMVLGLVAGWGLLTLQTPQYVASTSVLVLPTPDGANNTVSGRTNRDINLDTEAQLVRSAQVANAVQTALKSQVSATALRRSVDVSVPPNSAVLTIEFTATTPEGAQAGAAAYAQVYLDQRRASAEANIKSSVEVLTAQLSALQQQLDDVSAAAVGLVAGSSERTLNDVQRNVLIAQISDVNQRLSPLQATTITPGRVITDATLPQSPSSPIPVLNLGAGLMAGLLLGLAVAVVADRYDHRVRRVADVTRHAHLPVLADIRLIPGTSPVMGGEQAATFDLLRNYVLGSDPTLRLIQVAGLAGEAATKLTAVQLSLSLARASHEVNLLVADSSSTLPADHDLHDARGLVEVIRGHASMHDVTVEVPQLPGVSVVPPGTEPVALQNLLQSAGLGRALGALRASRATGVVQTAAPDTSAAAQAVAAGSDTVILVVELGTTDGRRIATAASEIHHLGTAVAGVVVVRSKRRHRMRPGSTPTAVPTAPVAAPPARAGSGAGGQTSVGQGATSR